MSVSACLMVGAKALTLAAATFTLTWTHSVEKTGWSETYKVTDQGLKLVQARVMGSGAGMDPGPGSVLEGDWWVWVPTLAPQPQIVLAASGATVSGWSLCAGAFPGHDCRGLGARRSAPIVVKPCADGS